MKEAHDELSALRIGRDLYRHQLADAIKERDTERALSDALAGAPADVSANVVADTPAMWERVSAAIALHAASRGGQVSAPTPGLLAACEAAEDALGNNLHWLRDNLGAALFNADPTAEARMSALTDAWGLTCRAIARAKGDK